MAHAWLPEASRIRATDGGPLIGGAPRAVWLTLGTAPGAVSVQSAAGRLISERRPCHLVWDPVTGEVAQLISVLRAGRALGAPDHLDWAPGRVRAHRENVNAEGRVCVQIGVLGHPGVRDEQRAPDPEPLQLPAGVRRGAGPELDRRRLEREDRLARHPPGSTGS